MTPKETKIFKWSIGMDDRVRRTWESGFTPQSIEVTFADGGYTPALGIGLMIETQWGGESTSVVMPKDEGVRLSKALRAWAESTDEVSEDEPWVDRTIAEYSGQLWEDGAKAEPEVFTRVWTRSKHTGDIHWTIVTPSMIWREYFWTEAKIPKFNVRPETTDEQG